MNLILVKNLKTKNIFRILSNAFLVENNKNKKIIIYKNYKDYEKDIYAMESDMFWGTHDTLSVTEINKLLYV